MSDLLVLPSDSATRAQYMPPVARQHPGKLDLGFLAVLLNRYAHPGMVWLDPMAGCGSLLYATLRPWACNVVLNELEPQWVAAQQATRAYMVARLGDAPVGWAIHLQTDARTLRPALPWQADGLLTSQPYEDTLTHQRHGPDYHPTRHAGGDASYLRRGYDAPLDGGAPAPGVRNAAQIGNLRGARYAAAMAAVWAACVPLVTPGGPIIAVIKNKVRANREVDLVGLTRGQLEALGCTYATAIPRAVRPAAWHNVRRAVNPDALVIDREWALVMRAPA